MTRSAAFLVAAVLLCVILSSEASDELQCTGERGDDGLLHFKISPGPKDQASDCEVQWIVDERVDAIFEHGKKPLIMLPITMATVKNAILQGSPNKVEWMLLCPSTSIDERRQCSCKSCNDTPPTRLPEGYKISVTTLTTLAEGSPNGNAYIWIGLGVFAMLALAFISVAIVIYRKRPVKEKRQIYSHARTGSAQVVNV